MSKLITPLKRLGGKSNMSKFIISHLPRHNTYIEVFGGSAPVLMAKSRCKGQEVYNDLDGLWVNTWKMIRDHNEELADLIHATPYSRTEFLHCRDAIGLWRKGKVQFDCLELARMHIAIARQSFSADGRSWSTSTTDGENRPRLWARLPIAIVRCLERMRGVYIEQQTFQYMLERYDDPAATFYLDPPYLGCEQSYYDVNRDAGFDHLALRNAVENVKGSVVISYYDSPEIVDLYAGWRCERKQVVVHAGDIKRQETELLLIRTSDFGRRKKRFFDLFAD